MRDDRERRIIEKAIHVRVHGPLAPGAAIPHYCEDDDTLRTAVRRAEALLGQRIVEEKRPSNGERFDTSLIISGQPPFPGCGSTDVEARAQALAILLGLMRVRSIPHLPAAINLAKERGLVLEPCLYCRHGVLLDRPDANSPTGNTPIVPCPHCGGRAEVWWSHDRRFVPGFSDEHMIQRVAPEEWKKLVEGEESEGDQAGA